MSHLTYYHLPPFGAPDYGGARTLINVGYPRAWVDRYKTERMSRFDPILRRMSESLRPFWFHDLLSWPDLRPAERGYMDLLGKSGLSSGYAVPAFGPRNRNGYAAIVLYPEVALSDRAEEVANQIAWAIQIGHVRCCELIEQQRVCVTLSAREHEILRWIARGKSNSVIAQILELSGNTIDSYVRRIFVKLGVSDRMNAVLRGVALGLVA